MAESVFGAEIELAIRRTRSERILDSTFAILEPSLHVNTRAIAYFLLQFTALRGGVSWQTFVSSCMHHATFTASLERPWTEAYAPVNLCNCLLSSAVTNAFSPHQMASLPTIMRSSHHMKSLF